MKWAVRLNANFAMCAAAPLQRKKPGRMGRALRTQNNATLHANLLRRSGLRDVGLERLVGFLGEISVELAHLGGLRDKALVGRLRIVSLDLNRLLERLHTQQLLHDLAAVLEGLLRVV